MAAKQSFLTLSLCIVLASAHEHVTSNVQQGAVISDAPIDRKLWLHIAVMLIAFGILFPMGVIFGLSKSRWHVPTQVLATGLAIFGVLLAHTKRTGRQFQSNIHAKFAPFIIIYLIAQVCLGVYLRLHLSKGLNKHIRRVAVFMHGWMGAFFPVFSWVQIGFGGITALGFCRNSTGDHLGQCLAHGIMGSAFIGYGICLLIMLHAQSWLTRLNISQELIDSSVIMAWGLVNTFTEHRWGDNWSMSDYQHTSMGVVWLCAGLAGVFLSSRNGKPKRHVVPAAVILLTGWAMSGHAQALLLSTKMHGTFGYTLMAAGVTRIVEVAVILRDQAHSETLASDGPRAFQYIPPFLLISSGLLFMGSNEEQLVMINDAMIDAVSYSLILFSLAFLLFFYANYLIHLYFSTGVNANMEKVAGLEDGAGSLANGHHVRPDGIAGGRPRASRAPLESGEDFELGLMSDDNESDEEEESKLPPV